MLDKLRARAFGMIERAPGRVGASLRKANEALGRPLADAGELEDRRAFATGKGGVAVTAAPAPAQREQAPVIVYFMDKQKRDVGKLTDILDANGVTYTVTNIQEDPAAQYAVKRDAHGVRLPVVFVAGDCVGGRQELVNAAASGELTKKVFG
ncbi:MAG TPA: glutaredoxin domain-containing protein [Kofleriaceae bacterium]|jgi:glutaredoxin-related protein